MSKQNKRIVSYVTPKEYRQAVALAKESRRSVSDYIRMLIAEKHDAMQRREGAA